MLSSLFRPSTTFSMVSDGGYCSISCILTFMPIVEEELGYIFTQVLTIPLANELPTPNARKTCALAIWLIQVQRLPAEVLEPAKDRIAYALRRGIDGELGKEGKKGSASDGLKVCILTISRLYALIGIGRPFTTWRSISQRSSCQRLFRSSAALSPTS